MNEIQNKKNWNKQLNLNDAIANTLVLFQEQIDQLESKVHIKNKIINELVKRIEKLEAIKQTSKHRNLEQYRL